MLSQQNKYSTRIPAMSSTILSYCGMRRQKEAENWKIVFKVDLVCPFDFKNNT